MPLVGVWVLVAAVVVAVGAALIGAARRAGAASRVRGAELRLRQAMLVDASGGRDGVRARIAALADSAATLSGQEAGALVLASRRTFSRDVIPILVAVLGHRDSSAAEDAARALSDLGSPGLRSVWQALDAAPDGGAPAMEAFLLRHPDWLFERLVEGYAAAGEASVERHQRLWRATGMLSRLALLRGGSDAINSLRAEAICRLLGVDDGRVA